MSKKNFKVETTENGQTTKSEIKHPFVYKNANNDKTPTGKVTTLEDKKKRREAREKQYRDFRIAALKRRAKRLKLSDEETKKAVEKLCEQLDAPNNYMILVLFNTENKKMIMEQLKNNDIEILLSSDSHLYVRGDQELLKKIRELMPSGSKIHPYAVKAEPVLLKELPPKKKKKPMNKKDFKKSRIAKKKGNTKEIHKKGKGKAFAKLQKRIRLLTKKREKKAKTVAIQKKKSNQLKKAA